MMRRISRWVVPGTVFGALFSANLSAEFPPPPSIERVYSTNSSNDYILQLDFAAGTSKIVNTDAGQRVQIEGIAVRDDGPNQHLLVCDRGAGEVLFYEDADGAGQTITDTIRQPHSVSLDQAGNAYVVSANRREVWKLPIGGSHPGGYGPPVLIAKITGASLLAEAKLLPFSAGVLAAGGLITLSRVPAVVYYHGPNPGSPTGFDPPQVFIPNSAFPRGSHPTSFAMAPKQEFLIATDKGTVLRFDAGGAPVPPHFAAGFGKGVSIAVGAQDGKSYAFVADPQAGGSIKRFLIKSDGTGTLDASVKSQVSVPGGVNIVQGVPTPVGQNVVVTPAPEAVLTFDSVGGPGISTAQILAFADNRPALHDGNSFVDQPLRDFFEVNDPLHDWLPNVIIPAHVQAFRKGDPQTGPPYFLLAILDTTAALSRTVEVHYDEAEQLGYEPSCTDADVTMQPRTFYAPQIGPPKSEPPIVEGDVFVNFSTDCGSNIGRGGGFSLWLTGRETDPPVDTADSQLANIQAAMDFYPCIDADVKADLEVELQAAVAAFEVFKQSGDPDDQALAIAHLEAFIAVIDANPGAFTSCAPVNVGGELIARAQAAQFSIGKVPVGGGVRRSR